MCKRCHNRTLKLVFAGAPDLPPLRLADAKRSLEPARASHGRTQGAAPSQSIWRRTSSRGIGCSMSGRLSNLSFNLVDWKIREQILTAKGNQLESLLCALELPPAEDGDRQLVKRLDAGEFHQILHPVYIRQALRVDRARFAKRAVELYERESDFMRHM